MQLRFKVAGMSDMGLVRTNNEDNFQIARDLSVEPMRWINNEACLLTDAGALLVVADGMGGMNAGEVASQIAIDTVRDLFTPDRLKGISLQDSNAVNSYLTAAVAEADRRIKVTAASHPETHGMGTTIVIAWLIGGWLYVAWCGDSRAYVYNSVCGLGRLTKDHSYVQSLVDIGKLTDEQAFDYPQSNIITRCLSDSKSQAEAETLPAPYQVADGDIILLCTDGLSGMIRDRQTEEILRSQPPKDLTLTAKALIDGALRGGGADNVTVALLQVVSGGIKPNCRPLPLESAAAGDKSSDGAGKEGRRKTWLPGAVIGALTGAVVAAGAFFFLKDDNTDASQTTATADIDLINGRDSLYQDTGYNAATPGGGQTPAEETLPAGMAGVTAASADLATVAGTMPSSSVAGSRNSADSVAGNPKGTDASAGKTTKKEKTDSASLAGASGQGKTPEQKNVLDPNRKTVIITIGDKKIKTLLLEHNMKYEQLKALNPNIDFGQYIPPTTKLTVYEK